MKCSLVTLLMTILVTPLSGADPALPVGVTVYQNLPYISNGHDRQKLDLYVPKGDGPFPVVLWVHGGAWRGGSKKKPPALPFLEHGAAVASINYRLSQHAVFPAQIEDCKTAVRWLRVNAGKYNLNTDRIVAWGSSAGGHLVAMLGTTGNIEKFDVGEHLDQSSMVTAVVDAYGPTDFLQMDAMDGEIGKMDHDAADSPESKLVGGPIQENKDKVKNANPITYVSSNDPPFLIVHGDKDPLVAHGQSVILYDALKKEGVSANLYTVKDGGHGWFKDPQVKSRIRAFITEHLGLD